MSVTSSWCSVLSGTLLLATAACGSEGEAIGGRQANSAAAPGGTAGTPERFRADAWHLPDEPLLGFVEIPGGPFLMGSDPALDTAAFDIERWSADQPQATVEAPTFLVGRYEVTVAQYRAFVESTGHPVPDPATLAAPPDHPVTHVSWPDALAYTRWLERRLREWPETPARLKDLLAQGWRTSLPTEAEWEKAARGVDGRIYPWGKEPRRDRANYGSSGTTPVAGFNCPECPYGLADMSGNVWEWTRSPYQPYPYQEADDRADLESEALWVMRGGSFGDDARLVRAAVRGGADPGARRPFIGFRVALTRLPYTVG